MITRTLKHPFVRPLVYLVCALMVLAGDPLLALDQNVRVVPKDEQPDWLETWTDGDTYRNAWDATASWSRDSIGDLEQRLGTWWDGTWVEAWDVVEASMTDPSGPRHSGLIASSGSVASTSVAVGQVPIFAAVAGAQDEPQESGLSDEELKKLAETDSLARPDEAPAKAITKAEPMPSAEGLKVGGSSFRPPKELIQQLNGKADLDNIPLIPGLNLLSLPEEPASTDPATVFNAIGGAYTKVWVYEHCDTANPWKIFDPNDPASSDLTEIDHTNGFWIEATTPVDLPSDGALPPSTTFELCPGWNLIGYPAAQPRHITNALHTIEGQVAPSIRLRRIRRRRPVGGPQRRRPVLGERFAGDGARARLLGARHRGDHPHHRQRRSGSGGRDHITRRSRRRHRLHRRDRHRPEPDSRQLALTYERIGETEPIEIASGVAPVAAGGVLAPSTRRC